MIFEVGGQVARTVVTNRNATRATAVSDWNSAFNTLNSNAEKNSTTACGRNLGCYIKADTLEASYFSTFADEVQAITMPSAAAADATAVVTDATQAPRTTASSAR